MTERLVRRGLRITQDLEPNQLATLPVRAVMSAPVAALTASMTLAETLRLLAGATAIPAAVGARTGSAAHSNNGSGAGSGNGSHASTPDGGGGSVLSGDGDQPGAAVFWPRNQWTFPVVDEQGALVGIVSRGDLLDAAADESELGQPLSAIATAHPQVATPDESMSDALDRLLTGDFAMLPVVAEPGSTRIVGAFSRGDAARASRTLEELTSRRARYIGARRAVAALNAPAEAQIESQAEGQ